MKANVDAPYYHMRSGQFVTTSNSANAAPPRFVSDEDEYNLSGPAAVASPLEHQLNPHLYSEPTARQTSDEHILEEVRPRYIIMYEPDSAFIRRVEVYRSSHVGRNVRVYFIYYGGSVEEQRYLSAVRREKDSFTKLIKEKGVGLLSQNTLDAH